MRRRFLKLFRLFRKYKYGEDDEVSEKSDNSVDKDYRFPEEIERNSLMINNQLKEIEKYLNHKLEQAEAISDLHTVHEDSDEELLQTK